MEPDTTIEPMTERDVDEVLEIDRQSFPTAWHRSSYLSDLRNTKSHYFVARSQGRVLAYAGTWLVEGEAHITTLAVRPAHRRQHLGRRLLVRLIRFAAAHGATRMTLEVREHNQAARRLYEQFGFRPVGVLKGYYIDTGEDALVMWLEPLDGPGADAASGTGRR